MFFDLNVPVPNLIGNSASTSKKGKGKQPVAPVVAFNAAQMTTLEARLDLLVHLGYTVIAFAQTIHKKVDSKTHVNTLDGLIAQLKPRPGIVYLKRLSIILDEDSEKGFGLINANVPLFNSYDLIALIPTTHATFSLACLTHSLPSPLTAHIIALPLTIPRLPYYLKHTLVRTAIKNGAVFEINYVGALGGDNDPVLVDHDAAENGPTAKRNWWASTREVVRVTKGKGLIVSSGVVADADLRSPRDVGNLITVLGLPQDAAHDGSTRAPKSLVIRAQTRKTYRAVFSEPVLVIPEGSMPTVQANATPMEVDISASTPKPPGVLPANQIIPKKRSHDSLVESTLPSAKDVAQAPQGLKQGETLRKKQRKRNKESKAPT